MKILKHILILVTILCGAALLSSCQKERPVADFSYSISEQTVYFQNLSQNADRFQWTFGDGEGSTERNPQHTYQTTNRKEFTVTLMAYPKSADDYDSKTVSIRF